MNEVEVINSIVIKRHSVIESPEFLFSAAIWSQLVHSWPGLN